MGIEIFYNLIIQFILFMILFHVLDYTFRTLYKVYRLRQFNKVFISREEDINRKKGISQFRFDPKINYALDSDSDILYSAPDDSTHMMIDRLDGTLREWWYRAWVGVPPVKVEGNKGKPSLYKFRKGKIFKSFASPHPRGIGFINYEFKQIGAYESEHNTFWKPVYIDNYE